MLRYLQSHVDLVGGVDIRIVEKAFPAHRSPRFFKVGTHDDQKILVPSVLLNGGLQADSVVACHVGIMYGAGPHDDQ